MSEKSWLIDNRTKVKRRYWEPITILWVGGFGLAAVILFFIPATLALGLWIVPAFLTVFGGLIPFKDGPGFLHFWDRYQDRTSPKRYPKASDNDEEEEETDPAVTENQDDEQPEEEYVDSNGKKRRRRRPINALTMEYYNSITDEATGVLYMPQRIADASTIVALGFEGALADSDEFYDRIDAVSESVLEAARASMLPLGVVQGIIKRPLDITRSREWQQKNVHKKILASIPGTTWQEAQAGKSPEAIERDASKQLDRPLTGGEALMKDLMERDALKQKRNSDTYHFWNLLVPRPEDWPLGAKGNLNYLLDSQQIDDSPILKLTKLVEQGLIANGVLGVQTLDLDGLHTHLRKAWDMGPTMRLWNEGAEFTETGQPFDPTWPWPPSDFITGVDRKRLPYIEYGKTNHRLYQLVGLEHKVVRPRQLQRLFQPGYLGPVDQVGYGMATVGETVLATDESRAATRAIRARKAFNRITGADSGDRDLSQLDREEAAIRENERDAFDHGGSHGLYFNQYFDLSVYAEKEKDRFRLMRIADEKFRLEARTSRISVRPIRLAPHMNRVFWSMYGGAGMQ